MAAPFDLSGLSLPELRALNTALLAATAAGVVLEPGCEIDILMDAEGVSVAFTVFIAPELPIQPQKEE